MSTGIELIHLDGMIVRTEGHVVDFEVSKLRGKINVAIYSQLDKVIHDSNYTEKGSLNTLIEKLEVEASQSQVDEEIYLKLASYLESMIKKG